MTLERALKAAIRGRVSVDAADLERVATDFGGWVRRVPIALVQASCDEDVIWTLTVAREMGVPVVTRGAGHSQSGQGLSSGIALEMTQLSGVECRASEGVVVARGGTRWKSIVDAAHEEACLPEGLTLVTDTTIGGTLSMGGVGAESFRVGPQVQNVQSMEVATLEGVVVCSADRERELFDAVRAGLGQFGVILRATYPVRRKLPNVRAFHLVYLDAHQYIEDLVRVTTTPRCQFVTGNFVPHEGRWALLLTLGVEFQDHVTGEVLEGLRYDELRPSVDCPVWDPSGAPGHGFFRQYVPPPRPWTERTVHPWVDHSLTAECAAEVFQRILSREMVLRMSTNCILAINARAGVRAPLFALPDGEGPFIGAGIFPALPQQMADLGIAMMSGYSREVCVAGGKRYLSGYLDMTADEWATHYGDAFGMLRAWKTRFDPAGLLNPGVVPI